MPSLTLPRRVGTNGFGPSHLSRAVNFAIPVALAALAASAAYAGADTTFTPALTKFTYMPCSIYVLFRFGQTRNRKIRLRWGTMASILTGLAFVVPAHAQEQMAAEAASAPELRLDGFRVAEGANGFQLVEHGIWRQPARASSGVSNAEAGRTYLPYRYAKPEAVGPSGFRRASYLPHVYAAEAEYSLPSGLLDALVWTESRYNPLAISKAGAAGLGQLMPGTARALGVSNRFDPMANIFGAARYLRQMLDKFGVASGPRCLQCRPWRRRASWRHST